MTLVPNLRTVRKKPTQLVKQNESTLGPTNFILGRGCLLNEPFGIERPPNLSLEASS